MKWYISFSVLFVCLSCNTKNDNADGDSFVNEKTEEQISSESNLSEQTNSEAILNDVMEESDILFNGKLKRYFTLGEFEKVFGKPDSSKLMTEEAPCSYIFENEEAGKDLEDKYLFKDGSRFENSKNKVAVDEFRFLNGNFIFYKEFKIDSKTTIKDFAKIFPNSIKNISRDSHYYEENLQSVILREDELWLSDGHIRVFFKDNKIHSIWWWFPC